MDYKLNVGLGLIPGHEKPKSKFLVFILFTHRIYKILVDIFKTKTTII